MPHNNNRKPDKEVLFFAYSFISICGIAYPVLCALNELSGNDQTGLGYYYGIPQIMLPSNQRPHVSSIVWPGIPRGSQDVHVIHDTHVPCLELHLNPSRTRTRT